jgi:hypothetical protein
LQADAPPSDPALALAVAVLTGLGTIRLITLASLERSDGLLVVGDGRLELRRLDKPVSPSL